MIVMNYLDVGRCNIIRNTHLKTVIVELNVDTTVFFLTACTLVSILSYIALCMLIILNFGRCTNEC